MLKPITILVGKNSSGKSTFARIPPLLRQSAEANKRGPLLWWGRLVDYGGFDEAVNRNSHNKEIGFDFRIRFDENDFNAPTRRALGRLSVLRILQSGVMEVSIQISNGESGAYTSCITMSVFDFTIKISIDSQGFVKDIVSGSFSWKPSEQIICYGPQDRLIPNITFFKASEAKDSPSWELFDYFGVEIPKIIRQMVHGNTADSRIRQLTNKIPLGTRTGIFKRLLLISNPPSFGDYLRNYGSDSIKFTKLCDYSFVSQMETLLYQVNNAINGYFSNVVYLEPLRATAQRYYRKQSLAVEEIDSKGENIAMYLESLSDHHRRDFQQWTTRHFGISVTPTNEGGHTSLIVKQSAGGAEANIADMGVGISQMLPIAAQLWAASSKRWKASPTRLSGQKPLIVIEQPELHLHPEYQARIADVFVAAVTDQLSGKETETSGIRILAETHSPSLINRLGELIAENKIDREAVQVILFEQDNSQSETRISISDFDSDGILQNWPTGFFEYSSAS